MARATVYFEWQGREYEHDPKSADWYWALGIIAVASAIGAMLFANYLFAILIIIAAAAIALHGAKEPPTHLFRITEQGLLIGEEMYPFQTMKSFSVLEDIEGALPPLLSIKTTYWLSPHLVIPLSGVNADALYAFLLEHISEEEHRHTVIDQFAHWLGF